LLILGLLSRASGTSTTTFLPWFHLPALLGYHHWSITTSHITYENKFSITFEMLEFKVITLQEVSKPMQSKDMSKINLPCD
jgi:hypothetical protein